MISKQETPGTVSVNSFVDGTSSVLPVGEHVLKYDASDVSVAIPTFGRDRVLLDTIEACLLQQPKAGEILVIDQTPLHDESTERRLSELSTGGQIGWIRLKQPSIPAAMNQALLHARNPIVLFLDDDIVPAQGLIEAHAAAHGQAGIGAVVGQIIQPWQQPADIGAPVTRDRIRVDFDFPFHSVRRAELSNAMAGHLSLVRERAIAVGGFDENFQGTAYRFETEFARRLIGRGSRIVFEPKASIRHLRAERGGTRTHGNHLTSASPDHGVGDYYFALGYGVGFDVWQYVARRMVRENCTRFHLRHPWFIPVKLLGEIRALLRAWQLRRRGPVLIENPLT